MRYILYDNDNIILICDSVSRQFIIIFHPRMVSQMRYYVNHAFTIYFFAIELLSSGFG